MKNIYIMLLFFLWTCTPGHACSNLNEEDDGESGTVLVLPVEGVTQVSPKDQNVYLFNDDFLRLEGYTIQRALPLYWHLHRNVSMLSLSSCGILVFDDIQALGSFENLRYLKLLDVGITDTHLKLLSMSDVAEKLLCLDIGFHEITDPAILFMVKYGKFYRLKQLCLWNEHVDVLTECSINDIAISPMADTLTKLCMSGLNVKKEGLTKEARKLISRTACEYKSFYSRNKWSREIYMLDDPIADDYIWVQNDKGWFLQSRPVVANKEGQPNADWFFDEEAGQEESYEVYTEADFFNDVVRKLKLLERKGEIIIEGDSSPRTVDVNLDEATRKNIPED